MLAGVLRSRLLKPALTLGLLVGMAGLADCATSPVSPPPMLLPPVPAVLATLPAMPAASIKLPVLPITQPASPLLQMVAPEFADSLGNTPAAVDFSLSSKPRPALLGGEAAREFERGGASWYGGGFHGKRTASGERFDMYALTAAHRTLPFGTLVRVHSLVNGRNVDVRITDRGPFSRNRVIDVSRAAAEELGMLGAGFKEVVLMVPESTQPTAEAWPVVVKKRRHVTKRPPPPARR